MTGLSSWIIWTPMLRPWPYRFFFLGFISIAFVLIRRRALDQRVGIPITATRFGVSVLGGQFLALLATILSVGQSLGWQSNLAPQVVEGWLDTTWRFYIGSFCYELGLMLTVITLVQVRVVTWDSIGIRRPSLSIPLLLASVAVCYFILHFVVGPVNASAWHWVTAFVGRSSEGVEDPSQAQFGLWMMFQAISKAGVLASLLCVLWMGVLAPIIEEMFFRGLVFAALCGRVPVWVALISQALLFAVMHIEPARVFYLFAFGLMLGYLVRRTSSLLPAMLLHIVVNVTSLVVTMV